METNTRNKFKDFLIKIKDYPANCFLANVHIVDTVGKNNLIKVFSDLAIIDTVNNNYLALVEFKGSISQVTENDKFLHGQYLKVLNDPYLNYYFVTTIPNNDFEIYSFNNEKLTKIDKADFPDYEAIRSKIIADKQKKVINELDNKKRGI